MEYLEDLKRLNEKHARTYAKIKDAEKEYTSKNKENYLRLKSWYERENIEINLIKNNIYLSILKIYNEKVRTIIIEKYKNKNIGDKRKEEINKIFEDALEEENIYSYIHFSLSGYDWYFGTFYVSLYMNKEEKENYNRIYYFDFNVDNFEDDLKVSYNADKHDFIEDTEEIAYRLFNKKLAIIDTLNQYIKNSKNFIDEYDKFIEKYNFNASDLSIKCNFYNILNEYDYIDFAENRSLL